MNLEERQKELDKLRHKHPELKKALKWYRICEAFSFCQSEKFAESSDDQLTSLLKTMKREIQYELALDTCYVSITQGSNYGIH